MLEIIESGTGERVVFVHGDVFGAEATWAAQQSLAAEYRLVMVNRRGFGRSPDVLGEDFEVDAHDVVEVLSPRAHLVGHSYGGVVALLAAAASPDRVQSLVVFEPPALGLVADRPDVQEFRAKIEHVLAKDPEPEEFLARFIEAVGGDPGRLPSPLPLPLAKAAEVLMHGRWPWEAHIPLDVLANTKFPKLVVSGGHSPMFDAVCDVLEDRMDARREVHAGAGHSIPTLGEPVNESLRRLWVVAGT